ncbi:MAG TPA: hypothetical protein DCE14_03880 [Kosmotogaceae bacterium]|nr:MAG: Phosphoglycerate mutase [Thermotogales bacterium 46_20]HAA85474.1 hypothetical protein [Kosmotogaceae bacterium]
MRVFLVRHGETEWNSEGRWQGQEDICLNERGIEQVNTTARTLGDLINGRATIYTSDLRRAKQTAEILGKELQIVPIEDRALRECDFGLWNGMTLDEIKRGCYKAFYRWVYTPEAEVEKTESLNAVQKRAYTSFTNITRSHYQNETIVIVSHALWIKVLICKILGSEPNNYYKIELDNGSFAIAELHDRGYWKLDCLNISPRFWIMWGRERESQCNP